jgi:hypothetical protein
MVGFRTKRDWPDASISDDLFLDSQKPDVTNG